MKTSFRLARWLTLGLAVVAVSVPCRPLGAAFVRYQNFDTYTNGATYTDASGGTLIVTNDNGNLVGTKAVVSGNDGLYLDIPDIVAGTTGTVYFRTKWSAAAGNFGHYLMTATTGPCYSYYWGRGPYQVGTQIGIVSSSGGAFVTTPGWTTVPVGVWTRWWIYADNAAHTFQVWVQDETGGTQTLLYTAAANLFTAVSTADIKALGFFNTVGGSTTFYLDDFYVDTTGQNLVAPVPPSAPSAISPTNTATGVSVTPTLSWVCSGADGYQASLWPDGGATNTTNVTSASWTPGTLGFSSNYNWQIVATNIYGNTTGGVWTFTTMPLPLPVVNNSTGATPQVGYATLSGNLVTNGGVSATVYTYWGPSNGDTNKGNWSYVITNGVLGVGPFSSNTPSTLLYGQPYYYRTYATNSYGDNWAPATTNFTTLKPAVLVPPSGYVIRYTFEKVSGTTVTNDGTAGATYNGTLSSTATLPTIAAGVGRDGGNTLSMTGPSGGNRQYVAVGSGGWVPTSSGVYSISLWFYGMYDASDYRTPFNMNIPSKADDKMYLADNSDPQNLEAWQGGFYYAGTQFSMKPYRQGQAQGASWHMLTFVANGTVTQPYVDGAMAGSTIPWRLVVDGNGGSVGMVGGTPNQLRNFAQYLDDVYVYDRQLTSNEVVQLYQAGGSAASLSLTNFAASGFTATSAVLNATLTCSGAVYNVTAYWNTTSGGTNAALWTNSTAVGSWTNVASTNISCTATGLTAGTAYFFTFCATNVAENLWATNVLTFAPLGPPIVNNSTGATPQIGYATLSGNLLSTGGVSTTVYTYWGPSNGDTNKLNWSYVITNGVLGSGTFSSNTPSTLLYGQQYYYRTYATNASGDNWAPATSNFLTLKPVGGGAPVTSGLQLWFDASQITGKNNGDAVATWSDMSGNNHNTTGTFGSTPTFAASVATLNNKPAMQFAESGYELGNLSALFPNAANLFVVAKINDLEYNVFETRSVTGWWRWNGDGRNYPDFCRNTRIESYHAMPTSGQNLFVIESDATHWEMWGDGTSWGSVAWSGTAFESGTTWRIAGNNEAGPLTGWIPEILVYNRSLTSTEKGVVGGYLAGKYGLTTTYPAYTPAPSLSLTNFAASGLTVTSAVLNATLACTTAVYNVTAYWNTTSGGTNAALWTNSAAVGSWTNVGSTNISCTATGLTAGTLYFFTFCATNAAENLWATNVLTFATFGPPIVNNSTGATPQIGYATLNGNLLSTGGVSTTVYTYWGTSNGDTNKLNWSYVITNGVLGVGPFASNTPSTLLYGQQYYYRTYATNASGDNWAPATTNFTTLKPATVTLTNMVPVGDAGNAADTRVNQGSPGANGAVAYNYSIGKYELSVAEWVAFLNAKAASDPYSLWNSSMPIARSGSSGSYTYSANAGMTNKAISYVSWFDAIRFANWMNNGRGSGDTETGTYTITGGGADSGTVSGQPTAGQRATMAVGSTVRWLLPSIDEWYKAAFYDPTKTTGVNFDGTAVGGLCQYWRYATKSDTTPTAVAGGTGANQMVYGQPNTDPNTTAMADVNNAGGLSYYGTMAQGGDLIEYADSQPSPPAGNVGGGGGAYWDGEGSPNWYLSGKNWGNGFRNPTDTRGLGFRLVSLGTVPPAVTLTNFAAGGFTATSAVLNATLTCSGAVYNVTAYWNTTSGGTNAALWTNSAAVGSWTNVASTNISCTATGLTAGTGYFFTFCATNAAENLWATNVLTFATFGPPIVNNSTGATPQIGYATLNGNLLSTGGVSTTVYTYWGTSNGDTNKLNWSYVITNGVLGVGPFASNTPSTLLYGQPYYYRAYATNSYGDAWAPATTNFTLPRPSSFTWNGTSDSAWSTGNNWSPALVPGTGDTAAFNNAGNGRTNIDLGGGVTVSNVLFDTASAAAYTIGIGAVGSQTLTLNNGGALTMNAAVAANELCNAAIALGTDATAQSYTFTQSSAAKTLTFAGNLTGGSGGTAGAKTLTVTGAGSTVINGNIANGGATSLALTMTGAGTLTLGGANTYSGNTTVSTGTLSIATGGSQTGTTQINPRSGTVNISGTLTVANGGVFAVGSSFGSTGTVNVATGAALNIGGGTSPYGGVYIGGNIDAAGTLGTGTLTINGGTVNVAAGGARSGGDGTSIWLGPWGEGGTGSTLNLNGGTLSTARPISDGGANKSVVNLNGGVLQAAASITLIANPALGVNNVRNNGAIFDTQGYTVSITHPLAHSNVGGDNATDGGLTKLGPGTLTLTGANSYTGPTLVNAGTLALSGSGAIASSTNITVASGATFDVSALTAALTLASGQALRCSAAGTNAPATLAVTTGKGLTLSAGGLVFTNYTGGSSNAFTVAGTGGALALASAPVTVYTTTPLGASTNIMVGTNGAATVTGTPGALTISGSGKAASTVASLAVVNSQLLLIVTNLPAVPPTAPSSPSPTNTATGVGINPTLSWSCTGADGYQASLWATGGATNTTNVTSASWTPGKLGYYSNYNWQIVATNVYGSATGGVWTFTTTSGGGGASYRLKISFPNYSKVETLTNFPALVVLSNGMAGTGFNFGTFLSTNGYDLRFWNETVTTNLNYEIESWSTGASSYVWVQITNFTSNSYVWATWGDAANSNQPAYATNGATWSADYKGVWHLPESVTDEQTTGLYMDSSPSRINGQQFNTSVGTGIVGRCAYFDGNDYIAITNPSAYEFGDLVTASIWFRSLPAGWYANWSTMFHKGHDWNWCIRRVSNLDQLTFNTRGNETGGTISPSPADGNWHNFAATYRASSTSLKLYYDGALYYDDPTPTATLIDQVGAVLRIGANESGGEAFQGLLDEARVSQAYRSANWVWAEYMSVASNSFFNTLGTVQPPGNIKNTSATNVVNNAADLVATLNATSAFYQVWAYWGTVDGTNNGAGLWQNTNSLGSFSDQNLVLTNHVTGLLSSTLYYYTFRATNDSTNFWASPSASFTTRGPPTALSVIAPTNTATGVGLNPTLSWSPNGADGYQASLWATGGATNTTNVTSASWTPGKLGYYSNYNWQIVATNLYGSTTGGVWTFTTTSGTSGSGKPSYRLKISFPNYSKAETLTNFPALVVLSNGMAGTGFDFGTFLSTKGYDLRFWNETATTNLNYQIDSWSTGASSYVWVQITNFTSNSYVWATWGDAANSNQPAYATNGATWDASYRGVYHLNEAGADTVFDSTTNGYNSTQRDTVQTSGFVTPTAQNCNGGQKITLGGVMTMSAYSKEVWVNKTANGNLISGSANHAFWVPSNYLQAGHNGSWGLVSDPTVFPVGSWQHVAVTYDSAVSGGQLVLYRNGAQVSSATSIGQPTADGTTYFAAYAGANYLTGSLDEGRISSIARSSNWIWACYMNQASNSFFNTLGTVQPPSGIQNTSATNVVNNAADLVATLSATSAFYQVWAYWGTVDGTNNAASLWQNTNSLGSFSDQNLVLTNHVTGLLSSTLYYYTFRATNESTNFWASPSVSFTTRGPPTALAAISPTNTATGVGINPTLSWSCTGADGYQASLWATGGATNTVTTNTASWSPGTLGYSSNYNWQIVATNIYGSVTGGVWTFTTRSGTPDPLGYISPTNNTPSANPNGTLVWSNAYPATGYDVRVWLSSGSRPANATTSVVGTAWSITPTLQFGSNYNWEVVASNSYGSTTGATWTFTTWTPGTFVWNGLGADNNWDTPLNWTNNSSYPQFLYDTAILTGTTQPNINLNGNRSLQKLSFEGSYVGTFMVTNIAGNALTLASGGQMVHSNNNTWAANKTITSALTLNGDATFINDALYGALDIYSQITGSNTITIIRHVVPNGYGAINMRGNNTTFTGSVVLDNVGLEMFNGNIFGSNPVLTLKNGSTINNIKTQTYALTVPDNNSGGIQSWGGVTVSGTISVGSNSSFTIDTGSGNYTALSGALSGGGGLNIVGRGDLSWEGNETWLLGTAANTYSGTTTVRQGCLQLQKTAGLDAVPGDLVVGIGTAPALVRLDNSNQIKDTARVTLYSHASSYGILKLNGKSETIGGLLSSGTGGAFAQNGDAATVSTLTVSNAAACAFGGIFRNGGAAALNVVKAGSGAFFVNSPASADTWTGTFTVNGGTLGGTGVIAAATTVNTAALAPGSGGAGTLTIANNLSLTGGSALNFELGLPGAGTSDAIAGVVNLALNGTLNVTKLAGFNTAPLGSVWTLITYSGTLGGSGLTLGSMPGGYVWTLDTSTNGQVNLRARPTTTIFMMQ